LAASGAKLGVDVDMVAIRSDRTCRAKIKAAPAAHYLRSRVGAEVIREFDIARLVEISDEIACSQHRPNYPYLVTGIDAQIAVA
jgi:hypothetical protein